MNAAVTERPKRRFVDFSAVPPSQWKIHDRLENWARWNDSRAGVETTPMFRLHKSDAWHTREYGAETTIPVDKIDAQYMEKGVAKLPAKNRSAIQWFYLRPRNAVEKARELGVDLQGLADLVLAGRQMLVNRRV